MTNLVFSPFWRGILYSPVSGLLNIVSWPLESVKVNVICPPSLVSVNTKDSSYSLWPVNIKYLWYERYLYLKEKLNEYLEM